MRVLSKLKKLKATRILGGALGLLLALSLVLVPAPALAAPVLPHQFYGTVTIDAELAPEGTIVSAQIGGIEYLSATVDAQGRYGWDPLFKVPADDPNTPEVKEGGVAGETVEFYVLDTLAGQYEFEVWGITALNLTVSVVDTTPPTVTITELTPDPTSDNTPTFTGTATDTQSNITSVEYRVDTGSWSAATASDGTFNSLSEGYTFTTSAFPDGAHTVYVRATDAATNTTAEVNYASDSYTVDTEAPTVVIDSTASDPTNISPIPMTATFSEDVTGFEVGDINVGNGAAGNFAGSGADYTFDVTPTAEGEVTVDIAAGVAQDAATNLNEAATQFSITYTTAVLAVTINPVTTPTNVVTQTLTGTMSAGLTVALTSAEATFGDVSYPTTTTWSAVVTLVEGSNGITATADTSTATATIVLDTTVPTGDLGDEIADTPSGGTVQLLTGTYTGDVIIDKPITITGTEGTVISGGIHIVPLAGSNVTIENVTITDYTAYGIRIELVGADDVFIIRNNIIEGVVGSLIGIKVDRVDAGGSLNIRNNAISDNEIGIKLLADVADATIHFNDITGNTVFGLEQLAVVSDASAIYNWWGDISGPEYEAASFESWPNNPGGLGDAVSDNVDFIPWLTRDFQTVLDDNIAYFGYPMVWLDTGWNIISTPIALDPVVEWEDSDGIARTGVQTWGEYVDLGDGLAIDLDATTYYFDGEIQDYVQVLGTHRLKPCDAIYVKMAEPDVAAILLSPSVSVPSKELYAGWNLVSLAWLGEGEIYAMPADEALVTVEEVAGGLTGYKLVVSPGVNAYEPAWIYIAGDPIEPWTDPELPPDGWMWMASGYWVFMLNDGTLAGFTFTPISLD